MGKRGLRKRIEGLRIQISKHENKIKREKVKAEPDLGRITHWKAEIEAFKKSLERALKRLEK